MSSWNSLSTWGSSDPSRSPLMVPWFPSTCSLFSKLCPWLSSPSVHFLGVLIHTQSFYFSTSISSPWVLLAFEALCELPCAIHLSPLHVMSFLTFFYWVPLPGMPLFLSSVSIPSFKRPLNNFSRMSYFSKPLVFSLVCWVCSVHLIWFLKSFVWLTNWK